VPAVSAAVVLGYLAAKFPIYCTAGATTLATVGAFLATVLAAVYNALPAVLPTTLAAVPTAPPVSIVAPSISKLVPTLLLCCFPSSCSPALWARKESSSSITAS
jgi:hypothetical protein